MKITDANKKKFTIAFHDSREKLFLELEKFYNANSDVIERVHSDEFLAGFKDRDPYSSFYYYVLGGEYKESDKKTVFGMRYQPKNGNSLVAGEMRVVEVDSVIVSLTSWVKVIRRFNSIPASLEDQIEQQYKDEIFAEFEYVDDDSDSVVLEIKKQLQLIDVLERFEDELKQACPNDPEVLPILEESAELRSNIQNITKRNAFQRVAKIFAKVVKQKGAKFFKELFTETRKEAIKKIAEKTVEVVATAVATHLLKGS